jgi:hypothetical protein
LATTHAGGPDLGAHHPGPEAQRARGQLQRRVDHLRQRDGPLPLVVGAGEGAQVAHDLLHPAGPVGGLLGPARPGGVLGRGELGAEALEVEQHVGERVVDLVGDAGGKQAHAGHTIGLGEPRAHRHDLGDIARHGHDATVAVKLHGERGHLGQEGAPVLAQQPLQVDAHGPLLAQHRLDARGHHGALVGVHQVEHRAPDEAVALAVVPGPRRGGVDVHHPPFAVHHHDVGQVLGHRAQDGLAAPQGVRRVAPRAQVTHDRLHIPAGQERRANLDGDARAVPVHDRALHHHRARGPEL